MATPCQLLWASVLPFQPPASKRTAHGAYHRPGFWSGLRGKTGAASKSTSPSEATCVIVIRTPLTSKTVNAAFPVARLVALFGQTAP